MILVVRRFLLLVALLFWQGGFMFYGAVVVPIGSEVLGSHEHQGWITRSVTNYLNLGGLAALGAWGWDIASADDPVWARRCCRWVLWNLLVLMLALLAWLHVRLDEFLDLESFRIVNPPSFRAMHAWYLNISTIQWAGSFILLAVTLLAWRASDGKIGS
jgi:hypothetical protein